MKILSTTRSVVVKSLPAAVSIITVMSACIVLFGCAAPEKAPVPGRDRSPLLETPSDFDLALKQNQAALADRKTNPDLALYNLGILLAHPSNPKRDPAKALYFFKTLVAEQPRSAFVDQAKTWIQVLEQQQKLAEERQKLTEEKRALNREREMLAQERQKLNYSSERSWQLDMEIEKRRRQSLSK
jgi:hypothetical protein